MWQHVRHRYARCRTCCLRRFRASRPPQNSSFRGSIPHPIRSLCTLRTRRRRRLRNTRFPAARYHLTGADLSPAETRQLRLTHRNRKFESISLQRGVRCELDTAVQRSTSGVIAQPSWPLSRPRLEEAAVVIRTSSPGRKQGWAVGLGGEQFELGQSHTGGIGRHLKGGTDARDESGRLGGGARDRPENAVLLLRLI